MSLAPPVHGGLPPVIVPPDAPCALRKAIALTDSQIILRELVDGIQVALKSEGASTSDEIARGIIYLDPNAYKGRTLRGSAFQTNFDGMRSPSVWKLNLGIPMRITHGDTEIIVSRSREGWP